MSVTYLEIETELHAKLKPQRLEVVDDSHLHAGHAGALEGKHFTVRITGDCFNGLSRLARHRLIYDTLQFLIPRGIHALVIEARALSDQ
jgi:BolA family transcriptional regulator, general stress-responsive regulator